MLVIVTEVGRDCIFNCRYITFEVYAVSCSNIKRM